MYVVNGSMNDLAPWIRQEIEIDRPLREGDQGRGVRRVQEWLTLHGYGVVIDEGFGPVTAGAVARFQADVGFQPTGVADEPTFSRLVEPMRAVLQQRLVSSVSVADGALQYARAHLEQHPREVGGPNGGPWVRLYMHGREGRWCAGFVSFILHQAVESLQVIPPVAGSASCDSLAAQARSCGRFLSEAEARQVTIGAGSIFLVRKSMSDWTHTGFVVESRQDDFGTIEGNTNDEQSPEGYEVCALSRGYARKDFIMLS